MTSLAGGTLVWTTLALGGYLPATRPVTSLLVGLLLAVHFASLAVERPTWRALHPASWAPLPLLAVALANVLWVTPVPWLGWIDLWVWWQAAAVFWVVANGIRSPAPRLTLFGVLVALGLVAVALGCYQRFVAPAWLMMGREQAPQFLGRASGPFGIPNSLAAGLILLLPSALALASRGAATARVWWGWVAAVLALGLFLTLSRGAWLSLALAGAIWPLLLIRWPWRRRLGLAGTALAGVVAVAAAVYLLAPGARSRLDRLVTDGGELSRPILWRAAWQLWQEKPVAGTGAGSFNVLFERYRPAGFVDEPQWAHNDYLQVLSELGLVGLLGLLGGIAGVAWVWRRRWRPEPVVSGGGLDAPAVSTALAVGALAFTLHLSVDFHLRLPALALAAAVVVALALGPAPAAASQARAGTAGPRGGRAGWWGAAGLTLLATGVAWRGQHADALAYAARETMARANRGAAPPTAAIAPVIARAAADLRCATAIWPGHAGAWSDLAGALEFHAFLEPGRRDEWGAPAEAAARAALARTELVAEFWLRLAVALDLQGRRAEARPAFERALELAPRAPAGWYYYADHLSWDTNTRAAALRAIGTCLSLDPGNVAAEALRAKLGPLP